MRSLTLTYYQRRMRFEPGFSFQSQLHTCVNYVNHGTMGTGHYLNASSAKDAKTSETVPAPPATNVVSVISQRVLI
jgi:hypothetical protein